MPSNISRTDSNHAQAPHVRVTRETKRIIVGVDFGTSTTKVMYRPVELGGLTRLIDFVHGHRKFPSYAMPSSIRVDSEHRLWFGAVAENGEGQVFRSFKVCVACQVGAIVCRGCSQNNMEKDVLPLGRFADSRFGFIPAHELMVYYLAWLLQEVDNIIGKAFGESVTSELQYNLGVPVSHLNAKPELVDRFEWILHTAVAIRGKIQQGISVTEARASLIDALPTSILPQPGYRRHHALPETSAAAMWLQKTFNDSDLTNYMLLDIGAGTTDITIYRYSQVNPDGMPIYAANSIPVAADNIDFKTIQWFAQQFGLAIENSSQFPIVLLHEIRHRKEFLSKEDTSLEAILSNRIIALDKQTYVKDIVKPHAESIFRAASETFSEAYQRARHVSHWPKIKIVLLGGGSRILGMKQYVKEHHLRNFMEQHLVEPRIPANMEAADVNDFQLLAVAYGLSFPFLELPRLRMPNQILPMQQNRPDPEPEYHANPLLSN
jgi:hypothetical protein